MLLALAAPSNVSVALAGAKSYIHVGWQINGDSQIRFDVEKSTNGGSSWSVVPNLSVGATANGVSFYALDQAVDTAYRVAAIGLDGATEVRLPSSDTATMQSGRDYQLEVTATADSTAGQESVELSWASVAWASTYYVWRTTNPADGWGEEPIGSTTATSYSDPVTGGVRYYYRVVGGDPWYPGQPAGYVSAGVGIAAAAYQGKVVLVDAADSSLAPQVARLEEDLVGDGWQVVKINVTPSTSVTDVHDAIYNAWNADQANVKQVLLLGHVAVPYAGGQSYASPTTGGPDGHGGRALPSDGYYGDMDGTWSDSTDFTGALNDGYARYRFINSSGPYWDGVYPDRNQNHPNDGKFDSNNYSGSKAIGSGVATILYWIGA